MTEPRSARQPDGAARTEDPDRVVIRDKRKIDPVTGEPRPSSARAEAPTADAYTSHGDVPEFETGQVAMVEAALLDERTADLQRLQAEYANYRRRAERDRLAAGEVAVSRVLAELLPVFDDIDRARMHGDLTGALKAVADHLDAVVTKLGLESFGDVGDPFDPNIHEAVMHTESEDVTAPTATTVMRKGYRHGDRLLRPAMVGVSEPANYVPPPAEPEPETSAEPQPTRSAETNEGVTDRPSEGESAAKDE